MRAPAASRTRRPDSYGSTLTESARVARSAGYQLVGIAIVTRDFARPLRDRVRHHTVEPNRRQEGRPAVPGSPAAPPATSLPKRKSDRVVAWPPGSRHRFVDHQLRQQDVQCAAGTPPSPHSTFGAATIPSSRNRTRRHLPRFAIRPDPHARVGPPPPLVLRRSPQQPRRRERYRDRK